MVSEQFDPAMGRRSTSSIKVDQQSMLEMKEISRSMSVGINEILRELRKVQSKMSSMDDNLNSMSDNLSLLKEEVRIMRNEEMEDFEEDESYGDEDSTTIALINRRDSNFIGKSDPIPIPDPYPCPIPNPDPYPDPNRNLDPYSTLNSRSDQNSDLNFEFGDVSDEEIVEEELQIVKKELSGDFDEDVDDKQLQREGSIDHQPDPVPTSDPNPETTLKSSSDQNPEIESVSGVFSLHPNPDIDPDPPDVSQKMFHISSPIRCTKSILIQIRAGFDGDRTEGMDEKSKVITKSVPMTLFWPNSMIDLNGVLKSIIPMTLAVLGRVWFDGIRWKLPIPRPPPPLPWPSSLIGLVHGSVQWKDDSETTFIGLQFSNSLWNPNFPERRYCYSRLMNQYLRYTRRCYNFSTHGVYVEVVQGEHVPLNSIVELSISKTIELGGVEGMVVIDSGIHMEELEDTCQYFLEKIHQLEAVLNFLVGTGYSSWLLMKVGGINGQKIREYGMTGETSIIGIIREERYRGVGVYLQGVEGVKEFLPIELGSADLSWDVQWLQVVVATGRVRQIRSFEINISSKNVLLIKSSTLGRRIVASVPKFTQTFTFTFNPVTSPINQKVWLPDAYRNFLPPISRYSSSKTSSSVPELKPTSTRIETVGEPPPWLLPPPTPFDIHLIRLLVEARVAWFHCSLFEKTKLGAATKQQTSDVLLSMTKEQKVAEFGRSTNKRLQSQKKQVLILLCGYGPWYISWSFHKVAEKKSQKLLDFSKFVGFFKSWLSYGCNGDGEKERQEAEFSLKFLEGFSEPKMMQREGLSYGWLEDIHQEPPPPPQPPPLLEVFDIESLNRLFHFFPP